MVEKVPAFTGGVPPGGTTGQALVKASNSDNEVTWSTVTGSVPTGGTTGQALVKLSNANNDVGWATLLSAMPSGSIIKTSNTGALAYNTQSITDTSMPNPPGSNPAATNGTALTGMSVTHACDNANNSLLIEVELFVNLPASSICVFSLCSSINVNAIGGTVVYVGSAGYTGPLSFKKVYSPISTSTITYSVRAGSNTGTIKTNQDSFGSSILGGSTGGLIHISERKF